jgi:tungstate transport system substrate-binding protein
MRRRVHLTIGIIALAVAACGGGDRVIVGAGTTLVDSGMMSALEAEFGAEVSVVAGSTAEILELADQGAISAALVHDEGQELIYLGEHPGTPRYAVFTSRFLLVGPSAVASEFAGLQPAELMATIATRGMSFVSRADGSGTHARELALWNEAAVTPGGDWYIATGSGMGFTLQVADQRRAFTLVEEGAYLAAQDTIDLVPVDLDDGAELANPYHVLVIDAAGEEFVDWLVGTEGASAIRRANDITFGRQVYETSDDAG